ncbi:hypothetical protein GCM10009597_31460 [Peribacillus frigoritolerans]
MLKQDRSPWPTDAMYMKEGYFTWLNKRLDRIYLGAILGMTKNDFGLYKFGR